MGTYKAVATVPLPPPSRHINRLPFPRLFHPAPQSLSSTMAEPQPDIKAYPIAKRTSDKQYTQPFVNEEQYKKLYEQSLKDPLAFWDKVCTRASYFSLSLASPLRTPTVSVRWVDSLESSPI